MRRALSTVVMVVFVALVLWQGEAYLSSGMQRPTTPTATPTAQPSPTVAISPQPTAPPLLVNGGALPTPAPAATAPIVLAKAAAEPVPVADAAELVRPAVAFIAVRQVGTGLFLQPVPQAGVGSGVIFDDAGRIITNNHVVEGARDIRVTLPDGRTFLAKQVGADRRTDLAVIQIQGENLPRARLGDSDKLRIGEWVVAIGNALGLEGGPTVTVGVVGALNRFITEPNGENIDNLIQTDAAINPGNSGGPLINLRGEVVGVNTAIADSAQGIGFAISINAAKPIIGDLVAYGRVIRPFMGIQTVSVTPAIASRYELTVQEGLLIVSVERATPAARGGLQQGDVIAAIDGERMRKVGDLQALLDKHKPGDAVHIVVVRAGKQQTLTVTLVESPR